MEKDTKKYLGIDWGEKRIGLATGDSETKMAIPLRVVESKKEVIEEIKKESIDQIIIGLPVKMNEGKSVSYDRASKFIRDLKKEIDIPIETIDERLTSKAADSLEGDKKTKADRDATAAMLILQTYLDRLN